MRHVTFTKSILKKDLWRILALLAVPFGFLLVFGTTQQASAADKKPAYADVIKDPKTHSGALKFHQVGTKLYAELSSSQLNKDYLVLISIARGIGERGLYGGMTWGFGDDWLWQFQKVDDRIHIVRKNTRFKAKSGTPESTAVKYAYTDSILFSLPIATTGSGGTMVVDLTPVLMSDLPQFSQALPGFVFSPTKSTWSSVKAFKNNMEVQVAATYASNGSTYLASVPDSRGVTLNVHYSISPLPTTTYKPRLADPRVGYFLTAVKDFSQKDTDDRFLRYINRWHLEKADSSADLSPPKKPIIFWMEKTIPYKYRPAIQAGILEWNKAFEKAGFVNAIEVRQQREDDTWDPEDIQYNTFRWITSSAGFAMGPSRVNPHTGQILDADIIFDADFIQYWKQEYETFTPEGIAAITGGAIDLETYKKELKLFPQHRIHDIQCQCNLAHGFSHQLALGSAVLSIRNGMADGKPMSEELIMQGLKEVTMHEVGHTLGLRHNFKASTMLDFKEMNDQKITDKKGMVASVMDYTPVNLVPKGEKQGDYYTQTLGPYDKWAIEYGYKPFSSGEEKELKKIASRIAEPGLDYATDEDTRGIDPDPLVNRFDLGKDPLEYAKRQAKLVNQLWPDMVDRVTEDGEGYEKARQAFGILLSTHGQAMYFASRFVGGLHVNRDHKGDPNGRLPLEVVDVKQQREAFQLLEDQVFNDKPFQFPPALYNSLASTRWNHWGMRWSDRVDYPIHEYIALWQNRILAKLLSPLTLQRLHDSELKVPADQDAFTSAELLERLTDAIYAEVSTLKPGDYSNRKPAISSLRRNLQRSYLKQLSYLALGSTSAPQDCQTVAYLELVELQGDMKSVLSKDNLKLDTYTKAHLTESVERIGKVLESRLTLSSP